VRTNKKTTNTAIIVILISGVLFAAYKLFFSGKQGKKKMVNYLLEQGYSKQPIDWLMTLEDAYIKAWYEAAEALFQRFTYNGKEYYTSGGTAVFSGNQGNQGKKKMVNYLLEQGYYKGTSDLMTFDDGYIKAWYEAAKALFQHFTYNGKKYYTRGGSAV
jgi:ribulose bisphosphate carboxylase small subunit